MDVALARLARVAEGNHINLLNSGQSSLPPPSGGKPATSLFGSLNTSQPQQNANSIQAQTSSLFGNTTQPAQASSLFGNTTSQPAQTSSLFGNVSSLPQQGGGMFGSNQNQAGNNQQQQQGSSLFGGNENTQSGGGLFGSQQTNQQTLGGLFGSTNAQQTQPQQASLFDSVGQSQAQHPQATLLSGTGSQNRTSSLFGNMPGPVQNQQSTIQPPPVRKLFPSQIGQYTQQQTVPGVRILDVNQLRSTTRFNDLHEDLQKVVEYVDNFILGQIRCQEECAQHTEDIDQKCHQMPPDVEYCTKALDTMQQALENDAESIAFAKDLVKGDVADAKLSFRTIQNLKMPQQFLQSGMWNTTGVSQSGGSSFPEEDVEVGASRNIVEYFSKQADEMTDTLEAYKSNVGQIETYLRGVESNTMQQMEQMMFTRGQDGGEKSAEEQVRELAAVLRDFEHGITGVATRVGGTRDKVQEVMLGPDDMIGGLRTMRYGMP
ncbi:MAG: hypothetical protein ALECFALPRED_006798 [Alectoria fallacina]|uniref:Uncharacterized protein n=1 Tax=Alectoria fallacina TaxID=1903189 RepID=A0A8H3EUP6_9LECA|nr:MAG: hypothetical protein ALECFALPRED_006798 [Alectoria fallacina]